MKIAGINIPFTTLKHPKSKQPVISPDSARIQREIAYGHRLNKERPGTQRLEKRIRGQKRSSYGE